MKKDTLTINALIASAKEFCAQYSGQYTSSLFGVTDGKAICTFVEHAFKDYLQERFDVEVGKTTSGLDLPSINTDIKVTSVRHPQSSCPYKDSKQKIFGLGYNLIVFVYEKQDDATRHMGALQFQSCVFIDATRTADYQITTGLLNIIDNNGNVDDVFSYLVNQNIPADDVTLFNMAEEILKYPPEIGYLSISNALQWRLHYSHIVNLSTSVTGIVPIVTNQHEKILQ